jgi:hypothetical protein
VVWFEDNLRSGVDEQRVCLIYRDVLLLIILSYINTETTTIPTTATPAMMTPTTGFLAGLGFCLLNVGVFNRDLQSKRSPFNGLKLSASSIGLIDISH